MLSILSTLVPAGIILGATSLFIGLFIWLHKRDRQKKEKQQEMLLQELTAAHGLKIDEKDSFGHYLVAIDSYKKVLLYFDFSGGKTDQRILSLENIQSVKNNEETENLYEEHNGKSVFAGKRTVALQLELIPGNGTGAKVFLPFYQFYKEGMTDTRMAKAKAAYWKTVIENCIKLKTVKVPE